LTDGRLEPLSEQSRDAIVELVRGHDQLGPVLAGRGRTIVIEPHFAARADDEGKALVAVYDYDGNRTLVAAVDPDAGKVLSVEESRAQFQLSDEERAEAERLALDHPRAREFLANRDPNPLTRLYFPPHAPQHRYAIVFLRPDSAQRAYVVVDLSEERVVEARTRDELML
jgi:hypothetical protein